MTQTERKVRTDLTVEEKARLEKYGAIEFKSARSAWDQGTGGTTSTCQRRDSCGICCRRTLIFRSIAKGRWDPPGMMRSQ